MLLKFSTEDLLNSTLLHSRLATPVYTVSTTQFFSHSRTSQTAVLRRRTTVVDARGGGRELAEIEWTGRIPSRIRVGDEYLEDVEVLFGGCKSVEVLSKSIRAPTRLNSSWKATSSSLTLENCATGVVISAFHQNSLLLNDRFIRAPLPGMGSNFLFLDDQSSAINAEILASFFVMEIIRRNHYNISPHTFDKHLGPCHWPSQSEEEPPHFGRPRSSGLTIDIGLVARRLRLKSI